MEPRGSQGSCSWMRRGSEFLMLKLRWRMRLKFTGKHSWNLLVSKPMRMRRLLKQFNLTSSTSSMVTWLSAQHSNQNCKSSKFLMESWHFAMFILMRLGKQKKWFRILLISRVDSRRTSKFKCQCSKSVASTSNFLTNETKTSHLLLLRQRFQWLCIKLG